MADRTQPSSANTHVGVETTEHTPLTAEQIAELRSQYEHYRSYWGGDNETAHDLAGSVADLLNEMEALRSALREMRDTFLESADDYDRDLAHDDLVRAARLLSEPEPERRKCEECGKPIDYPGEALCLACSGGAS